MADKGLNLPMILIAGPEKSQSVTLPCSMSNLFSDDEDTQGGSKSQLTINEHYAKAFEYRKEREELERRKFFIHFTYTFLNLNICCNSKSEIWF